MKNIIYVKVIITKTPVETFLVEVKKEFVFKGDYFEDCDTIEEIRDMFYDGLDEGSIDFLELSIYKKDYKNSKAFEILCE